MDKYNISQSDFDEAVISHNNWNEDNANGNQAVFSSIFFEKMDMSSKQLNGAIFENCYFKSCNMEDAGFCFSEFRNCLFDRCKAGSIDVEEARLSNTTFEKCELSNSHFTHSSFDNVKFVGCDLDNNSFQNAVGKIDIIPEREKPKCKLVGSNGNIFVLLGIASGALRRNGQREDAENMRERVYASGSYYEALGIITEYVDDESMSEDYDESDDISM